MINLFREADQGPLPAGFGPRRSLLPKQFSPGNQDLYLAAVSPHGRDVAFMARSRCRRSISGLTT